MNITLSIILEHRQEFVHDPVDVENIVEAREHRLKMNRLFEVMRKIFIYVVYLCVVAVLAYENRDPNSYPTYRNLNDIFITPSTKYDKSFSNVSNFDMIEYLSLLKKNAFQKVNVYNLTIIIEVPLKRMLLCSF